MNGVTRSSINENVLWSISGTRCKNEKFGHTLFNSTEWLNGIKVSFMPCIKKQGHFASDMQSILRNLTTTTHDKTPPQPNKSFAATLIDINGDIKSIEWQYFFDARYEVGPEPIDRPKIIISYSLIPATIVK